VTMLGCVDSWASPAQAGMASTARITSGAATNAIGLSRIHAVLVQ